MTLLLIGAYNEDWNAGFGSVKAALLVSVSTMVAYSTPLSYFSDRFLAGRLHIHPHGIACFLHLWGTYHHDDNDTAFTGRWIQR
jgi:hypothetical protein